jgi:sortase A
MWTFVRHAEARSARTRMTIAWLDARQVSLFANEVLRRVVRRTYALEHLLLAITAVSLGWYAFVSISTAQERASLARELEHAGSALTATPVATSGTNAEATARALTARLAPRAVIGRIDVPRLKLSALAREGADARTLRDSVGHVPETPLPGDVGNAAFAGLRDTFFRNLEGVRKGDEIVVTTASGIHKYVVTATRVVTPTDTSMLTPTSERALTLVTCYPFDYIGAAPERFIVRAEGVAPTRTE